MFPIFPFRPIKSQNTSSHTGGEQLDEGGGGIALSIVIVIGICFLVLNICACAGVFYQRDRVRFKEMLLQRQYKIRPAREDGFPAAIGDGSVRDDEDGMMLQNREASTSTMDPHTKVSQWMAQEIEPCPSAISPGEGNNKRLQVAANPSKLGGSDRYDPRRVEADGDPAVLFPVLSKTTKTADIYGLAPLKREAGGQQIKETTAVIEPAPSEISTTGTGRRVRKARSKSQLSMQRRSINKRDVAVGDDDDTAAAAADPVDGSQQTAAECPTEEDATDRIRRLNMPKVLPDLPVAQQQQTEDVYSVPGTGTVVRRPTSYQQHSSPSSRYRPNSSIVKTNLPSTLVVAPHPRHMMTSPSATSASSVPSSVPEPGIVVRPGVLAATSRSNSTDQPDIVMLRCDPPSSSGVVQRAPSNRNSRSWYAQYSQSLMSQSMDEPESRDVSSASRQDST